MADDELAEARRRREAARNPDATPEDVENERAYLRRLVAAFDDTASALEDRHAEELADAIAGMDPTGFDGGRPTRIAVAAMHQLASRIDEALDLLGVDDE